MESRRSDSGPSPSGKSGRFALGYGTLYFDYVKKYALDAYA
jgi:hypothetical protein